MEFQNATPRPLALPFRPYLVEDPYISQVGQLFTNLKPFLTANRIEKFNAISQKRTQNVLCVFESTHHCHNISAVLRTMDALGFQDGIFLYSNPPMKFRFQDSVDRGSALWLTLRRAHNRASLAQFLKDRGYDICLVTAPQFYETGAYHPHSLPHFTLDRLPPHGSPGTTRPLALVFGNERHGVHPDWFPLANASLAVPMRGFTESLNLSVCAGIVLYHLHALGYGTAMDPNSRALLRDFWAGREVHPAVIRQCSPDIYKYYEYLTKGHFFKLPSS